MEVFWISIETNPQIDFTLESVEGTTILHEAVKGGDQRIVKLLLQAGAGLSLDIKDKSGLYFLKHCRSVNLHSDLQEWLRNKVFLSSVYQINSFNYV